MLRRTKGLSQRELADSAQISLRAVSSWELGECEPRIPELLAAMQVLNATHAERASTIALLINIRSERLLRQESVPIVDAIESGTLPGLGDLLRAMRVRQGWTQEQLAAAMGV